MIIRHKPAQVMYSPTTDSVKKTLKDIDCKIEEKDQKVFQSDGYITQEVTISDLSDNDYQTLENLTVDPATWQDYHSFFFSGTSVDSRYLYNYEFKEYENLTRTKDEKELPSGLFFNYLKQESQGDTDLRRNTYSIGESINYDDVKNSQGEFRIGDEDNLLYDKSLMDLPAGKYGPEIKSYTENYYRLYTDLMSEETSLPPDDTWLEKQSNMFVLFDPNYKKDFNPYWIESGVSSLLPDNSSELKELRKIITGYDLTKLLFSFIKNENSEMVDFDPSGPLSLESLKTWDIIAWLNTNLEFNEDADTTYLFDKHEVGTGISNYYHFHLMKIWAKLEITNLIFDNLPTFSDILNNKVCKSSIVGYKIEKMTSEDGNVIQTFYFEGSKARLFDTQLCYDKRYYYKVSELRAVVGVKYKYSEIEFENSDKVINMEITMKPSIKLIEKEAQLFSYRVTTPPLFSPDVIVSNETNIKNKIKFYLSDHIRNIGKHFDEFEVIRQQDEEYYKFAEQADYVNDKGLSMFSHRSATGNFEVYRIDFKPTTYQDFSDGYLGVYSNTDIDLHDKELHASFVDYVKHDKVYYYMFRSLSHHQKAGKPSMVFECELVQDADEVILKHKAYDLYEAEETYDSNKAYRKFIQIQPSLKHVVFKEHYDWNSDNRFIGEDTTTGNDSLWDYDSTNEYFKLRIKSKKTGKKFDLNIRFKQTKN